MPAPPSKSAPRRQKPVRAAPSSKPLPRPSGSCGGPPALSFKTWCSDAWSSACRAAGANKLSLWPTPVLPSVSVSSTVSGSPSAPDTAAVSSMPGSPRTHRRRSLACRATSLLRQARSPDWTVLRRRSVKEAPCGPGGTFRCTTTSSPSPSPSVVSTSSPPGSRILCTSPPASRASPLPGPAGTTLRALPSKTRPAPRCRGDAATAAESRNVTAASGASTWATVPAKRPRCLGARPRTTSWCLVPSRKPGERPSCSASCPRANTCARAERWTSRSARRGAPRPPKRRPSSSAPASSCTVAQAASTAARYEAVVSATYSSPLSRPSILKQPTPAFVSAATWSRAMRSWGERR
mmetsp:Transcript_114375/g.364615  ORF Transcript_114375/g.364615 Transcript_114375/m.364615 type:complete len:351 (-) Transcript_114375:872-1924(-)